MPPPSSVTGDLETLNRVSILVVAVTIDVLWGDPPNRFHPVAWMGKAIAMACPRDPRPGRVVPWLWGFALVAVGAAVVALLGWLLETCLNRLGWAVAMAGQALVLTSCFSIRSLSRAAGGVLAALNDGDTARARQLVAFHLVSRDARRLEASDLSAATIESVAENTSDSVVAPLLYYAVAGLPGVLVYRFVNTCDAMLGYRTEPLRWLGNTAARTDDLLNLIPARLTAGIMLMVAGAAPRRFPRAVSVWWRDRGSVSSPNAGHPMSAAAGVLGVRLEKHGVYCLGRGQRAPSALDVQRSIRLLWVTSGVFVLLLCAVLAFQGGSSKRVENVSPDTGSLRHFCHAAEPQDGCAVSARSASRFALAAPQVRDQGFRFD